MTAQSLLRPARALASADAELPGVTPELPVLVLEELTTPSPERTVTDEPSGKVVDPASPPEPEVTLLEGGQFAPLHVLVALVAERRLLSECASAVALGPELLAADADEFDASLAAAAHGSLSRSIIS
ncbi:hypothetical protein Q8A64_15620 [Oxalobacteraceae bacterium R-40]|uniref:Uncharacterized protein n=1 Tax=Keguizhuia sedimenti TaxID=3064264 RepID=A0ABU1BS36_9BURK|nr:hypothetical protein [Oxalobacteraceae bacterium R-40]